MRKYYVTYYISYFGDVDTTSSQGITLYYRAFTLRQAKRNALKKAKQIKIGSCGVEFIKIHWRGKEYLI